MRIPPISAGTLFIAMAAAALLSGGGVYVWQKQQIQEAALANKEKQELQAQVLELRQRLTSAAPDRAEPPASPTDADKGEADAPAPSAPATEIRLGYKLIAGNAGNAPTLAPAGAEANASGTLAFQAKTFARLQKQGENITSIYAPVDPRDQAALFISTRRTSASSRPLASIYKYNMANGEMKKIYSGPAENILRAIGLTDSKLVLLSEPATYKRGPCFSVWAGHDETPYLYIDISQPEKEPRIFAMPREKIDEGRAEEQECLKK